jgi:hypothetical protein
MTRCHQQGTKALLQPLYRRQDNRGHDVHG